jgi:secondary thiamine-phosphate synthase enzyme
MECKWIGEFGSALSSGTMNRLSTITRTVPEVVATATLAVETQGEGFVEITRDAVEFLRGAGAGAGILFLYIRHTSASLVIQENADPQVLTDLRSALHLLAPIEGPWAHDTEGPDDMPAHIRTMLTGVCLHVPVLAGALALGTWQGIYVAEHRAQPHRREIVMQFLGRPR